MAKYQARMRAIQLRIAGTSISDIARQLDVSKSTVSHWCRDISLSAHAMQQIVSRSNTKSTNALLAYTEGLRMKRQQDIVSDKLSGKRQLGRVNARDIYCIGLGLYWGEGYKKGSQEFGFTNSDPKMIAFYIQWLISVFQISRKDLILRISINEIHKERIEVITRYWAQVTKVPLKNFTQPSFIHSKSKKVYLDTNDHMGTLRVKVRRGTQKRRQVLGAIEALALYTNRSD
jgi:transposase-like protein